MSVLRARQPQITRVLPHPGNKRWAMGGPKIAVGLDHRFVFEFDGLASQIVTDIEPPDSAGAFEAVIRADLMAATMFVMSGPNNVNSFSVATTGNLVMQRSAASSASGAGGIVLATEVKIRGEWDGAAGSGEDQRLFIDDVLMDTDTVGATATTAVQTIGSRITDVLWFNGVIANVKWWLTTSDTNTEPEHFLKINEGNGTTLINYGSVGGTQTLTPGAGVWVFNP